MTSDPRDLPASAVPLGITSVYHCACLFFFFFFLMWPATRPFLNSLVRRVLWTLSLSFFLWVWLKSSSGNEESWGEDSYTPVAKISPLLPTPSPELCEGDVQVPVAQLWQSSSFNRGHQTTHQSPPLGVGTELGACRLRCRLGTSPPY